MSRRWTLALPAALAVAMTLAGMAPAPAQAPPGVPPGSGGGFGLPGFGAPAQPEFYDSRDYVRVELLAPERVRPGGRLPVAIVYDMRPRWHIWATPPSLPDGLTIWDSAIATDIVLEDAGGLSVHLDRVAWPEAHRAQVDFGMGPEEFGVFEGRAVAWLPITVPDDAAPGPHTVSFALTFQSCDDRTCSAPAFDIPYTVKVEVDAAAPAPATPPAAAGSPPDDLFAFVNAGGTAPTGVAAGTRAATGGGAAASGAASLPFFVLLLLAAIGGFLLNLTPCVLPVIPIKIMQLAQGGGSRGATFMLGVFMALGVISFWMALGTAIATVNAFTATNELFQHWWFSMGVGVLIALLAIGMCGLFSIRLPNAVYSITPKHDSLLGSFGFGVMAAVLSTPCTAPFMGGAIAAAVGQGTGVVLLVFGAVGLGMALPYLVLAANPKWVERMPRTGPASELIKQTMGLCMLAAAAFFIGIGVVTLMKEGPCPPSRLYWFPVFALLAAAAGWLLVRTFKITSSPTWRAAMTVLGVVGVTASIYGASRLSLSDAHGPIDWVCYNQKDFDRAKAEGRVVLIDFTAEWCINCKLLEKTVLDSDVVAGRIRDEKVAAFKVDLTSKNDETNAILESTGSGTIPWLVIFSPDGEKVFAQNWYTADMVLDAFDRAVEARVARGR